MCAVCSTSLQSHTGHNKAAAAAAEDFCWPFSSTAPHQTHPSIYTSLIYNAKLGRIFGFESDILFACVRSGFLLYIRDEYLSRSNPYAKGGHPISLKIQFITLLYIATCMCTKVLFLNMHVLYTRTIHNTHTRILFLNWIYRKEHTRTHRDYIYEVIWGGNLVFFYIF